MLIFAECFWSSPVNPDDFPIHRDTRYWKTLYRDLMRYRVRRAVHQIGCWRERQWQYPLWKEVSQKRNSKKRPTLSTCIMTMNAENRIRPLLQYIRHFSDEIVVGVDSKTTDNTLEACKGLSDELFVIESTALTCNAGLETLVNRCHGDWVLRLDDDEYPEPHFADFKQGILSVDEITHYKLPRPHLSSVNEDTGAIFWVNDGYFYPDFQMRLFRNDRTLLSFPGAVGHLGIQCQGKQGRLNTFNLIHLNLAINPRFKREEKLAKYIQRLQGEWVHPINERALLFEDFRYHIQPYHYPDSAFKKLLLDTTLFQRNKYLETLSSK
jgi:glycosyltransferase involved in cell wall biosynthesis